MVKLIIIMLVMGAILGALMFFYLHWFEKNRCYRRVGDSAVYVYIRHDSLASGIDGTKETTFVFLYNRQTKTTFQFSLNEFIEQFVKLKDFKE